MKFNLKQLLALLVCASAMSSVAFAEPAATPADAKSHDAQEGEIAQKHTAKAATQKAPAAASTMDKASAQYTDQQLKSFVDAAKEVDQIKAKYEGQLEAAKGQAEIDKIKAEADKELTSAVKAKGMTVEQYNTMHQTAMKDPKVLARTQKYL